VSGRLRHHRHPRYDPVFLVGDAASGRLLGLVVHCAAVIVRSRYPSHDVDAVLGKQFAGNECFVSLHIQIAPPSQFLSAAGKSLLVCLYRVTGVSFLSLHQASSGHQPCIPTLRLSEFRSRGSLQLGQVWLLPSTLPR